MAEGFVLDYALDDIPDLGVVEEGEHLLTVTGVNYTEADKNGNPFLIINFRIENAPNTKNVSHFIGLPGPNHNEEESQDRLRSLKYFATAFGVSMPINSDEIEGAQGTAILKVEDNDEYGEQNKVKRFVEPK